MSERVRIEVDGSVGRLTITVPDRLGALTPQMVDDMAEAVLAWDDDPQVRAIVLTGTGRGFCAGADLGAIDGTVDSETLYALSRFARAVTGAGTPSLALVNGVAAGAGVSLALACDYVIAAEEASFVLAFTNIGLMPDGGASALVAASIGRARATRMALTGERLPASVAGEWGLVAEVVPGSELSERGEQVLAHLAAGAPRAQAYTTAAINAATLDLDAALEREERWQLELLGTEDLREGVAAFLDKRTPRFTGE